MKQSKLTTIALAAGLGLMASASQVQALPYQAPQLIDDFNFDTDGLASSNGGPVFGSPGSGGYVLPGWSRTDIYANRLSAGGTNDLTRTLDCAFCDQGHFLNDSVSFGHGYWGWVDVNGDDPIFGIRDFGFDYGADVDGADVFVSFDVNGVKVAQYQWSDLPATGASGPNGPLNMVPLHADISGIDLLGITSIRLDVFSNGGTYTDETGWLGALNLGAQATDLDFNIDNVGVTPEPATMALMGLGLAGFGWSRRRKSA